MQNSEPKAGRAFRHRYDGPGFRRLFLGGLRVLPQSVQRISMPMWASIFYTLVPSARRVVEKNLEQVRPADSSLEARQRSFQLFVNYAQAISNMYVLHIGQKVPVEVDREGIHHLHKLRDEKRGAILVTAHMGFWQIAPFLMEKMDYPPMTMAMAEEPNRELAEFEEHLRARFRIVYTTSSPFSTLELAQIVKRGELVGMQMDRNLGGPHLRLPFFGKDAAFPLGPALLARATGCPLLPVFILAHEGRKRCTFHIEPPIEVGHSADRDKDLREALTKNVAVYQRYVSRYPEQWFNFYDYWNPPGQS